MNIHLLDHYTMNFAKGKFKYYFKEFFHLLTTIKILHYDHVSLKRLLGLQINLW